jgi:ABC-type transporter Mla subunit MlaD
MRRIALIASLLVVTAAGFVTAAGADDTHEYTIELYNAFGLVKGSEVKVAGVQAGTVEDLDINSDKRAVLTVKLSGPASELGEDTRCSSEPQSLIAEYFLDCDPRGPPITDPGDLEDPAIPASQVSQTVQNDLVANTLREPFRQRLSLLINEFGTALAGNPEDLNEAIRLGAPALRELRKALDILAEQATTIRDLNVASDTIVAELTDNRQDIIAFIQEARDTADISNDRSEDLSRDFDLLDNFLEELRPTLVELADVARQQTPLLADLRVAAPDLNELARNLPEFNRATERSLVTLGEAAVPGREALTEGVDELEALAASGENAFTVADTLDKFLLDLDSPERHVETDSRAAKTCDDPTQSCYSTGRDAPTGYSGFEGLLNYVYYQAGALNQFDQVGHLLHFSLFDVGLSPCGAYNGGGTGANFGVPKEGGGKTTDALEAKGCVSWMGASQPGINDVNSDPSFADPPRYDDSVCPDGSTDTDLCDPGISIDKAKRSGGGDGDGGRNTAGAGGGGDGSDGGPLPPLPPLPPGTIPDGGGDGGGGNLGDALDDLLGLGGDGGLLRKLDGAQKSSGDSGSTTEAARDLLDFLFSN